MRNLVLLASSSLQEFRLYFPVTALFICLIANGSQFIAINGQTTVPDLVTLMPTSDPPITTIPMTTTVSPPSMDDVRLSFLGNPIANNSIVLITDIGDNLDSRIQCITDNPNCCAGFDRLGSWFFPDGREVSGRSSGQDIYRTRSGDGSQSSIKLATVALGHRNANSTSGPTGLYRCIIPDRSGIHQILIVGIYLSHENMAEIAPLTNSFQLMSISAQNSANVTFSLTCISSGGPVDSVAWMRDGSLLDSTASLVLTNSSTASYTATLEVSGRLPGTYTCQFRGSGDQILSSKNVVVNGSTPPLNVQATRPGSSDPVEVSWSPPSDGATNITGYRIFYSNGQQSILVPSYVTSIVFNFVESQDEVGHTVAIRSESMQQLPSELVNAIITEPGESVSTESVSCTSTLGIAVSVTILVTGGLTAIGTTIILSLYCWRKKKSSGKNLDFAISANVAYGPVQLELDGEYVVPSYESPVGRHSNLYDLPTGQPTSPQPVVYATPHYDETDDRQIQSSQDT